MKVWLTAVCLAGCLAGSTLAVAQSSAFSQGFADRSELQAWFDAQSGDTRSGIAYWTGQRSLAHPGACNQEGRSGIWIEGCSAAQRRLGPLDARRSSEPEYRAGWNSYKPSAPPAAATLPAPRGDWRLAAIGRDCRIASPTSYGYVSPELQQEASRCEMQKAEARRSLEEERRQQIEVQRVTEEQQRQDEIRRRQADREAEIIAARQRQLAAEKSPENYCGQTAVAKIVITAFNELFKEQNLTVIDIEHMVTREFTDNAQMACHGQYLLNHGQRWEGTLTFKRNIAGEPIFRWTLEQ